MREPDILEGYIAPEALSSTAGCALMTIYPAGALSRLSRHTYGYGVAVLLRLMRNFRPQGAS